MAKIIYAVAGQGFGHSSRSHLIGQHLLQQGHELIFAGSSQSYKYLSKYFPGKVHEISGLFFVYENGNINNAKTLMENIFNYPSSHAKNADVFKNIFEPFAPDLVISDFEPFTAWWAWLNKIPYISIDHQHVLTMCKLQHDSKDMFSRLAAHFVTKYYYTGARNYIILNFFKAQLTNKKAILLPPVIRQQVLAKKPSQGQHIVFYSTDCTFAQKLASILQNFPDYKFLIYGFDKERQYKNCIFKKTSTETFLEDLASCKAVIATAGFSLISECLHFKKRMLLLPVLGQYEQILNAKYIEKLGYGMSSTKLDHTTLSNFLDFLKKPHPQTNQILFPDNHKFYNIINSTIEKALQEKVQA